MLGDTNNSKHYHAFEITEKGMILRQRVIAGSKAGEALVVEFTKGAIGEGRPGPDADIHFMTGLVSHALDVPIKENYVEGKNHVMVSVINGLLMHDDVMMTEIGIFARLVDKVTGVEVIPELLYGYTYTDKYDYVPAGDAYNLHREIAFNTVLSRDGKFEIVYDKSKVFVTHRELDDLLNDRLLYFPVDDVVLEHNLDTYPRATAIATKYGAGKGGCGEIPCGGESENTEVKCRAVHLDSNRMKLRLEKRYDGIPVVTQIHEGVYLLLFADVAVRVSLHVDYAS